MSGLEATSDDGPDALGVQLLDTISIPAGSQRLGTPFGGLSGIDYSTSRDEYVALSDDRSENAAARFYTLKLPMDADGFTGEGPDVTSVTTLLDTNGLPFARRALDPEAVRWSDGVSEDSSLLWTSEGDSRNGVAPYVRESDAGGHHLRELPLPIEMRPVLQNGTLLAGARTNQALESLTLGVGGGQIVTAVENALVQDGPAASLNAGSNSRVAVLDGDGNTKSEFVYQVEQIGEPPVAPLAPPINTYSSDRGLSELLAVNETDYLAVERGFASGVGFSVQLYWTTTIGATDVAGRAKLRGSEIPMRKRLLFDFADTNAVADNVEGITWGPRLPDGSRSLVLVSDDNFGFEAGATRFHLLSVPADLLAVRTPDIDRNGVVTSSDRTKLPQSGSAGDLDGDGQTGINDIRLWTSYTGAFTRYDEEPETVDLQVLSFNDFHGNLERPTGRDATLGPALDPANTTVGGAEYLASTLNRLRQGAGPSLTVAAGDLIGASPLLSGLFHDEPTIESLEAMHLDVSGVGNHEFDEGVGELLRIQHGGCHPVDGCAFPDQPYDGADFPYLAANVVDKATRDPILAPTWVKHVEGVPVGFIGMTLEGTASVTGANGVRSVDFLDEVATANRSASLLARRGVKAIVVLLHEGGIQTGSYGQCKGVSGPIVDIARGLDPSIDAVVTGHTHQPYICDIPDPQGQSRIVTSASAFGRVVTEMRLPLSLETGDVVRSGVVAMNHLVTTAAGRDPSQTAILDKWRALSAPRANRIVGTITADITRSLTRDAESDLANLVADAQLAATSAPELGGAEIALMNPGGVRADLVYAASSAGEAPGEVTFAEVFAVQPFAGSIVSLDLTGAQLEQILEEQFNNSGTRAATLILGVSEGFSYSWSASKPVGDRIDPSSMTLNGIPIDPARVYRVTANTFLADGGDGFTTFAQGTRRLGGGDDVAVLADLLTARSPVAPPGVDRVTELP